MTNTGKAVRLSKVARELNVGLHTIAEFLEGQGIEIDAKPNTKIESDVYDVLLSEFQAEKKVKEKSDEILNKVWEQKESITLESAKKKAEPAPEEEEESPAPEPAPVAKAVEEKIKETPVAKEKKPAKKKEEVLKTDVPKKEVKVVGKVDLDQKSKAKKAKEAEIEAEAAKKKAEKQAKDEAEVKPKTETDTPAESENQLIKAKAEKLSGPTVVGKIDLPKEAPKKKKPVATSSDKLDEDGKKRRKRKRVAKVNVEKQSTSQTGAKRRPGSRTNKPEISEADIQKEIKETLARLSGKGKSKSSKFRRQKRDAVAAQTEEDMQRIEEEKLTLKLTEFVSVSELSSMMEVPVNDIISACMSLGIFASINQRLDAETLVIISEEFGYKVEFVSADVTDAILEDEDAPEDLVARPPIVTVMGHVDHGKTSLLDHIRDANVIAGEAGGITQHIGAYSVTLKDGRKLTFLDTPGHEAFTAMRARGAQVTDLAIIVIAADDAVMPQTKEAISHAQAAGIPMIFAINKIDKDNANPDRIKEALSSMNLLIEEWGGKYQSQDISAKKGLHIQELLDKVLLEAEMLELTANPNKNAMGTVIESSLDKGRGYVTTLLVEAGTLRVGDSMLAGQFSGRVKAMFNERGGKIEEAGPSTPVSMLGFNGAPNAGDKFHVFEDEKEARNIALKRQQLQREQGIRAQKHVTIEEIGRRIALGEFKELNLVVKGDVDGSVEALTDSLQKLSTEKVQVNVIHKAVGQISESDVLLATASDAIVIGFQVRPSLSARKLAEKEGIQIRLYSVIYAAIDEMKEAMEGLLSARIEEKILGTAEIREVFKISKVGTIAGCFMLEGKIARNNKVRVIRDGIVIFTGNLGSLKRFQDDVKEVAKGYECGLNVDKFNDIQIGDNIEAFSEIEVKQTLTD